MSKQTIASWIVNVIKLAYDESDSDVNIRAHSTRAIGPSWALFKGASITSILEAADWSSDATFKKYYSEKWTLKVGSFKVSVQSFYIQRVPEDRIDIFSIFHDIICHYGGNSWPSRA